MRSPTMSPMSRPSTALVAMTRALAIELAPRGVRVNALCPGTMDTELMRECAEASGDPDAYYRAFAAYHPLGRLASPEEIAAFVLCLPRRPPPS